MIWMRVAPISSFIWMFIYQRVELFERIRRIRRYDLGWSLSLAWALIVKGPCQAHFLSLDLIRMQLLAASPVPFVPLCSLLLCSLPWWRWTKPLKLSKPPVNAFLHKSFSVNVVFSQQQSSDYDSHSVAVSKVLGRGTEINLPEVCDYLE